MSDICFKITWSEWGQAAVILRLGLALESPGGLIKIRISASPPEILIQSWVGLKNLPF